MSSDPILTTSQLKTLIANGTVRYFLMGGSFSRGNLQSIIDQLPPQIQKEIAAGQFPGGTGAGGFGGGAGGFGGQSSLTSWVTQNCSVVSANLWKSISTSTSTGGGFGQAASGNLYDCASAATK
jgi:hypothetical protein